MKSQIEALLAALAQTQDLLRKHGDKWVAGAIHELEARLARGDWAAIQTAVTEATGGMGSLRDRWISAANGDAIAREDEQAVNARLDALIEEVERTAREAAEAVGLQLFR